MPWQVTTINVTANQIGQVVSRNSTLLAVRYMVGAAKHLREAVLELRTDVGRPIICVDLISQGRIPGSANGLSRPPHVSRERAVAQ